MKKGSHYNVIITTSKLEKLFEEGHAVEVIDN